jgi:hypothetical protein
MFIVFVLSRKSATAVWHLLEFMVSAHFR